MDKQRKGWWQNNPLSTVDSNVLKRSVFVQNNIPKNETRSGTLLENLMLIGMKEGIDWVDKCVCVCIH